MHQSPRWTPRILGLLYDLSRRASVCLFEQQKLLIRASGLLVGAELAEYLSALVRGRVAPGVSRRLRPDYLAWPGEVP